MIWIVVYTCLTVLIAAYAWYKRSRLANFPPGPPGLPFVGNILAIGSRAHLTTLNWKKKYGDTYSMYFGRQPLIVLSNFETIRRVFGEENASGRESHSIIQNHECDIPLGYGLVMSTGSLWKTHRRFALSTLRDLGMGRNWLEDTMIAEVEALCQVLRETRLKPFDPKVQLTNSVANVICALIFGERFSLTDPQFSRLTNLINHNVEASKWDFVAIMAPFMMWFPNIVRRKILTTRKNIGMVCEFIRQKIREHDEVRQRADTEEVPDYLHAYQKEKDNLQRIPEERETFTDQQLLASLIDLFAAGTETTSTTVLWGFVFMVENPDVMRKVQQEIDDQVGRDKMLVTSDRSLLPYTEAVILEIQRCASLVPLGAPHRTYEEMTIDGYTIPANTLIVSNLYSLHRDPRYWKNPEQFDPSHFLGNDSKLIRPDGFAPFSIGKRACPGESLAKMELFLFMANLLRCFTLEVPSGKTVSRHNSIASVTLSPCPYELIFVPRT